MSIPSIPTVDHNHFVPPVQDSGSLVGRVITKIYNTASYIVCSINHVAQSIVSKCIEIGTFGRYTLEDLKSYLFKEHVSSETVEQEDSSQIEENRKNQLSQSRLNRHHSKVSVNSQLYRNIRTGAARDALAASNSPYGGLYEEMSKTVKLSVH